MTTTIGTKKRSQQSRIELVTQVRRLRAIGQLAPAATTATDLYTVPLKYICRGRVLMCERGGAAATYRIAVREDGVALGSEDYLTIGSSLPANTDYHTAELLLDETDVITVYASTADLSFTFLGELEPKDTA